MASEKKENSSRTRFLKNLERNQTEINFEGKTGEQAAIIITDIFAEPLPLDEPFGITLVVGGGKLVRAKYPKELPKKVCDALISNGYSQDHSDLEGTFKYVHDTSKNRISYVVYPNIVRASTSSSPRGSTPDPTDEEKVSTTPMTISDVLWHCDENTFLERVKLKKISYTKKMIILEFLSSCSQKCEMLYSSYQTGAVQTEAEGEFLQWLDYEKKKKSKIYKSIRQSIRDQHTWSASDQRRFTKKEKNDLLEQLESQTKKNDKNLIYIAKLQETKPVQRSSRLSAADQKIIKRNLNFVPKLLSLLSQLGVDEQDDRDVQTDVLNETVAELFGLCTDQKLEEIIKEE